MQEVLVETKRNNPEGSIDEIALHGFGEPIVFHVGNDIKAIEHLQGFLAKQQKKCAELSEEIFDLMQEQFNFGFNKTNNSSLRQGLKDVENYINDNS